MSPRRCWRRDTRFHTARNGSRSSADPHSSRRRRTAPSGRRTGPSGRSDLPCRRFRTTRSWRCPCWSRRSSRGSGSTSGPRPGRRTRCCYRPGTLRSGRHTRRSLRRPSGGWSRSPYPRCDHSRRNRLHIGSPCNCPPCNPAFRARPSKHVRTRRSARPSREGRPHSRWPRCCRSCRNPRCTRLNRRCWCRWRSRYWCYRGARTRRSASRWS
jgi:hypothetical protein